MRAIIRCHTNVEPKALDAMLAERDWWPNLPQEHEIVEERKREILSNVTEGDRDISEGTHLYTLYDAETRTWGVVSNPTTGTLTFRLKNPVSDKLKTATEKLIYDLQAFNTDNDKHLKTHFDFPSAVEMLEPNSQNRAYSGEIIPFKKLRYAIEQRKMEATVGLIAALASVLFSLMTIPLFKSLLFLRFQPEWYTWFSSFLERLATSAIVVATISWLHLLLYWLDLRRRGVIRWSLD